MATEQNMDAAYDTYNRFLGWFKYGSVAVAILTAIVIWLIAG